MILFKQEYDSKRNSLSNKENNKNVFRKRILDAHSHQRSLSNRFKHITDK